MKILANMFFKLSYLFRKIANRISVHDEWRKVLQRWKADEGNTERRLMYKLGKKDLVYDLGGYEGQWTSDIFSMYQCEVLVFEPYLPFAEKIERRFKSNDKIKVYPFGLGSANTIKELTIDADSTSTQKKGAKTISIDIKDAQEFIIIRKHDRINLMKINIEGDEYDLLEYLIEVKMIGSIENLQIQFHDFVPNAEDRMLAIQKELRKTHELSYQYKFLWENWRLRAS